MIEEYQEASIAAFYKDEEVTIPEYPQSNIEEDSSMEESYNLFELSELD